MSVRPECLDRIPSYVMRCLPVTGKNRSVREVGDGPAPFVLNKGMRAIWYNSGINSALQIRMPPRKNEPAKNSQLLEAMRINANAIIDEIYEIDYCLLTYKIELARAQPHVSGSLALNYQPDQKIRDKYDIAPIMVSFFKVNDESWVLRRLAYVPGELHLTKILSKGGIPIKHDANVIALLKEIDRLLQMRAKLIEITRPLRQNTYGLINSSKKRRRLADVKIDNISSKIKIDWSRPTPATKAAEQKIIEREARAVRKLEKQRAARQIDAAG